MTYRRVVVDVLGNGLIAGPCGASDQLLSVGVVEQPAQAVGASAVCIACAAGRVCGGRGSERRGDELVELTRAHFGLNESLGLGLERIDVGERQAMSFPGLLDSDPGPAGVSDRDRRDGRPECGGLRVGANHSDGGDQGEMRSSRRGC